MKTSRVTLFHKRLRRNAGRRLIVRWEEAAAGQRLRALLGERSALLERVHFRSAW